MAVIYEPRRTSGRLPVKKKEPTGIKLAHISHGFYRVSDRDAGILAKKVGSKPPNHGMELRVELPDGKLMWLTRTPYSRAGHTDAPERAWVYAVH
jgi:hypothetical protein